jgi:hypothetical protein
MGFVYDCICERACAWSLRLRGGLLWGAGRRSLRWFAVSLPCDYSTPLPPTHRHCPLPPPHFRTHYAAARLRDVMIALGMVEAVVDCLNGSYDPVLVTAACTVLGNFSGNGACRVGGDWCACRLCLVLSMCTVRVGSC